MRKDLFAFSTSKQMEKGVYRVLIYEAGQSPDSGSIVARIEYFAFINDKEGNGLGVGVIPKDLEERRFKIMNLGRDVKYFETAHFSSVNFPSPLEEVDEEWVAGLFSFYDSELTDILLKKRGDTIKQTKARSVIVERIRSLDSVCQRFAFRKEDF